MIQNALERAVKRCAVYTRKSNDEGLDQEFNSIDAQFESGVAYIASQKHEGWILSADRYDDPDYSGGSLNRPALQRLMRDVQARRVDMIVVYKIDRLTRSLKDFCALAETLDQFGVAFVSVTQQFNTSTAMGRLILNILLAFAQFERENGAERVRDKIAASKKKGYWMGGVPPLGYDVCDRKLIVNEEEARQVRAIFERFLQVGCVVQLVAELGAQGVLTKSWVTQSGRRREGGAIDRQFVSKLLRNPIYTGLISHKGTTYPGQHASLVEKGVWDDVQSRLSERSILRGRRPKLSVDGESTGLLRGLLFTHDDDPLYPTYTRNRGKLYRYYLRRSAKKSGRGEEGLQMIPAVEIERVVVEEVLSALKDPATVAGTWERVRRLDSELREGHVAVALKRFGDVWTQLFPQEQQRLLSKLILRVEVHAEEIVIQWREDGIVRAAEEFADRPFALEQGAAA